MIRLRAHAHRGSVVAVGFVIGHEPLGVEEARRRVLGLWEHGARVREVDGAYVITGLPPRRVRAELAPGAPLVVLGGVTSAAPLTAVEHEAVTASAGGGAIVRVGGGEAQILAADAGAVLDVAAWIELDGIEMEEVAALAAPPVVATIPAPPVRVDVREVAGVGAAVEGMEEVRAAMASTRARGGDGELTVWQRMRRWLAAKLAPPASVATRVAVGRGSAGDAARAETETALVPAAPAAPGWMSRMRDRLAAALWQSRLRDTLGKQHAEYLRRMLEMFDRGELDEALRHAVPLAGDGSGSPPSLLPPGPRDEVALSLVPPSRQGGSIGVGDDAHALIRARYRAALERLIRLERIEEAAFVLADLLGDLGGAIALLERHRRYTLAARLAEGHGQPPGLITRLWFLAGDRARAIATARRHGAWADAIARLERAHDPGADVLRLTWADQLASAGDFVQAVEAAWPLEPARALVGAWIEHGLAAGGTARARLLVRALSRDPARHAALLPAIRGVLDDDDEDATWDRLALADTLLTSAPSPELRTVARATVRALLRDIGHGADGEAPALLPRLVRFSDDAALRADQPPARTRPRPIALVDRAATLTRRWSADDVGLVPAHDAAWLPGGRLLVALGELGARVYTRAGRVAAHLDQPAAELVVSDLGTRALALSPRGEYLRLARLDLAARRAAHWCDVRAQRGARTYDGDTWLAISEREILAIDATADRWTATWGVDLRQPVLDVRRQGDRWSAETLDADGAELWFYDRHVLRARRTYCREPSLAGALSLMAARPDREDWAELAVTMTPLGPGATSTLRAGDATIPIDLPLAQTLELDGRFVAIAAAADGGAARTVHVVHVPSRRVIARLTLDGATRVSLRLTELVLVLCDDRGRVIALDLRSGTLRADLRLAP